MHRCDFFMDPSPTEIYTLSLHALFRSPARGTVVRRDPGQNGSLGIDGVRGRDRRARHLGGVPVATGGDRKSTRLNSSHSSISYAVFCLKTKKPAGSADDNFSEHSQPLG